MPFNPCGRAVAFLRDPVRDVIKPFRDSDVTVARQWYRCEDGAPPLGFPTAFTSSHWEPFPWLPRNVGEVFPAAPLFRRIPTPRGLTYDHVCGTVEDFQIGAVFNPDIEPIVYGPDGIPACCRPIMSCIFIRCQLEPINSAPASEWQQYAEDWGTNPDPLPFLEQRVASYYEAGLPASAGWDRTFYPGGVAFDWTWREQDFIQLGLQGYLHRREWRENANATWKEEISHGLIQWVQQVDGATGAFQFQNIGSGYQLTGSNVIVADAILPPYQRPATFAEVTPEV